MSMHASLTFGLPRAANMRSGFSPIFKWTCVGALAVPLWATWPALSLHMRDVPAFEGLTLAFLVAWLALLALQPRAASTAEQRPLPTPWMTALAFALAECGSAGFFLFAQRHISAAEANLIIYLWPGMVILGGAAFRLFKLRLRHLLGIASGFLGAAVLIWGGDLSLSLTGIAMAFAGGASWAAYCVYRLKRPAASSDFLAGGCALAAIVCGLLHLALEPSIVPSLQANAAAAAAGIIPTAIATVAWDKGVRSGDAKLLAVMAYATPLCSTLILTLLGLESLTWKLAISAVAIVAAGVFARADTDPASPRT